MENLVVPARQWLVDEFERRRSNNARYSLRAFANSLGISSGRLSELLSGKRAISARLALKLADQLELSPISRQRFLLAAQIRGDAVFPDPTLEEANFVLLRDDTFQVIAGWQHYAILSLLKSRGFSSDPRWIARRLGISTLEARAALDRLRRLGLVETKGSRLLRTDKQLTTSDGLPSAALRHSHRQNLEQAIQALDDVPVEMRSVSSITMAIDPKKIAAANKRIRSFRRAMGEFLESGVQTEVYNLNIQLVPVSKLGT
jgi:transcriptional regulator with XRE-family HTH domain